ncbi:MAG: response regulator transcription factor [Cyanobacteria bacterium P01_G01_bin.39]
MIRILIVDDQNLIREGIKFLLEKAAEIEIVGVAKDGESALEKITVLQPDIVLLDIDLPGIDGLTVANKISRKFPQIKVVMLSSHEDDSYVEQAMAAGAKGYLLKNVSSEELSWSIKLVYQGYSAFKSELLTTFASTKTAPSPLRATIEEKSSLDNEIPSNASTSVAQNNVELSQMEALLTRNHLQQQYAKYAPDRRSSRNGRYVNNVKLNQIKKTMKSFEFKLLVFIILFSLGFLVFVALS